LLAAAIVVRFYCYLGLIYNRLFIMLRSGRYFLRWTFLYMRCRFRGLFEKSKSFSCPNKFFSWKYIFPSDIWNVSSCFKFLFGKNYREIGNWAQGFSLIDSEYCFLKHINFCLCFYYFNNKNNDWFSNKISKFIINYCFPKKKNFEKEFKKN